MIGITAILHTWGQTLTQHLHLHCLVTGGALAADGAQWISGGSSFLFPVRALATVFRAKYLAGLQRAYDDGQLAFAGGTAALADRRALTGFLGGLRTIDWVVYAKRPFAGPEQVLEYLGRYTQRVALSNNRLVDHRDGRVRFHWKDYADHDRVKVDERRGRRIPPTLSPPCAAARFHAHSPLRFARESHPSTYVAPVPGPTRPTTPPDAALESVAALVHRLTGIDLASCPVCGQGRILITPLEHAPPPPDSS